MAMIIKKKKCTSYVGSNDGFNISQAGKHSISCIGLDVFSLIDNLFLEYFDLGPLSQSI